MIFKNNSKEISEKLEEGCKKWLDEVSKEILNSVRDNTAVDSGMTREGWVRKINYDKKSAVVGNPYKNSVWEEFGTGEFALDGNGRKGGWVYKNKAGDFYFTRGKIPKRAFQKAYENGKKKGEIMGKFIFKEELK